MRKPWLTIGILMMLSSLVVGAACVNNFSTLGVGPTWFQRCGPTTCEDLWAGARWHYYLVALLAAAGLVLGWLLVGLMLPVYARSERVRLPAALPLIGTTVLMAVIGWLTWIFGSAAAFGTLPFLPLLLAVAMIAQAALIYSVVRASSGREKASYFAAGGLSLVGAVISFAITLFASFIPSLLRLPLEQDQSLVVGAFVTPYLGPLLAAVVAALLIRPVIKRLRKMPLAERVHLGPRPEIKPLPVAIAALALIGLAVAGSWRVGAPPKDARPEAQGAALQSAPPDTSEEESAIPSPPPALAPAGLPDCTPAQLDLSLDSFDYFTGNGYGRIKAVNTSNTACALRQPPQLQVSQGGTPLHLHNAPADHGAMGQAGPAGGIGLAPGNRAASGMFWPGYRNAADQKTPESATVRLRDGVEPVTVPITDSHAGQAPFDLIDGAEIQLNLWAPLG